MDPKLTWPEMWPYYYLFLERMAERATYSLDLRTNTALSRIAKRWRMSTGEALRRVILGVERIG